MSVGSPARESPVPEGRFAPVAQPQGRPRPHPVMLLQGIVRSRFSLGRMARGLASAGFEVYNVGGPSPRLPLEVQVARFRRDLERLGCELSRPHGGAPPVMHGVGHSMGGVVLRVALAQADNIVPGRVVAVATPFLGTQVADLVCRHRIPRLVLGAALRDLSWHSAAIRRLAARVGDQPAVGVILGQGRRAVAAACRRSRGAHRAHLHGRKARGDPPDGALPRPRTFRPLGRRTLPPPGRIRASESSPRNPRRSSLGPASSFSLFRRERARFAHVF